MLRMVVMITEYEDLNGCHSFIRRRYSECLPLEIIVAGVDFESGSPALAVFGFACSPSPFTLEDIVPCDNLYAVSDLAGSPLPRSSSGRLCSPSPQAVKTISSCPTL